MNAEGEAPPSPGSSDESLRGARVLLADDDDAIRNTLTEALVASGFLVEAAADGRTAAALLEKHDFEVVLSDISMPGMDGLQLLRMVRQRDLDVPVVLVTGDPTLETAMRAVEYGALQYLVKPVRLAKLLEVVRKAVRLHRLARLKREALAAAGQNDRQLGDRAALEVSFRRALETLQMAYQPIVRPAERKVHGYEALVRPSEPTLNNPGALFSAAERLGGLDELGRRIRGAVAAFLDSAPKEPLIFVNLHSQDLLDAQLFERGAPLSRHAARIVLEVTERASLDDMDDVRVRIQSLRDLGYRIALDDLGAGYAGLSTFARLEPDVVKLDISLVREVHNRPVQKRLIESMMGICREMGLLLVAEGVETAAEHKALVELGCELFQGYLFARPSFPPLKAVDWADTAS